MPQQITITKPDDFHIHVRDGEMLSRVVPMSAAQFGRVLVMPNLNPPVTSTEKALQYRQRILGSLPTGSNFDPKMSLYLTDDTTETMVAEAAKSEHILGFKLYPAGATTNSASGVTKIIGRMDIFEKMAELDVALQVHAEVTDPNVDVFDREAVFIDQILLSLHREIPELNIVLEHVTTSHGVDFVKQTNHHIAATITPQHMLFNRNELFRGGLRPHVYCLPVLKREVHRQSVTDAALSGDPSFFLGTDSAPHTRGSKQSDCGCAGIFSANSALEYYAEVFDAMENIDKLEGFASHFGADFYKLPRNTETITLSRQANTIDEYFPDQSQDHNNDLVPLLAGETLNWSISRNA